MFGWMMPAKRRRARNKRLSRTRSRFTRLALEALEDRITPATLVPPMILDPVSAVRVDESRYIIRGTLQATASAVTTVTAYRDSNQNGVFDAGRDPLAGVAIVVRKGKAFSLSVPLNQNVNNQFFIQTRQSGSSSLPLTLPLITEDSRPPTVTGMTRLGAQATNASSVQFAVNFSEPVTGVDAADFRVVRSGSVASTSLAVSGAGSSYTVTVGGISGAGTLGLSLIDNDTIRDVLTKSAQAHPLGGTGAGNGNFTTGQTYTMLGLPVVSSITPTGPVTTNSRTIAYTVTFSENVTGVDVGDFAVSASGVTGATVASVTGTGATRTVVVNTGTGSGTVRLDLIDNDSIIDATGNTLAGTGAGNGSFTTALAYTIDRAVPVVANIVRAGEVTTGGGTANFTVTFSEAVTGVGVEDFALTASGISGAAISSISGSGATYAVMVNTGTGTGSVRLNLIDNDSILDAAGNLLNGVAAGTFLSGQTYLVVSANTDSLATVVLPPLDINLLGLRVQTSEIIVSVSADAGDGKLLGNLLTTASNLIDLQEAADALNQVLSTTVGLLNSADLGIDLGGSSFDARPVATIDVLTLHVAPVQLDLLGALVNTSPIDVSITANSGQGLILGNIVYDLANLFNDLPGQPLNIDVLNQKLNELLGLVSTAVGLIPPADVPLVLPHEGQILSLTVPALDLNLLGLMVETSPITVNADAEQGGGKLLGNVLTSLLGTLDATPDKIAQLNNTLNGVLARVVGVLNTADLTVSAALVGALPPALQTLLDPILVAPAGSTAPILDLIIVSQDGTSPPVEVDLLGLVVTTSNIDAHISATTGDGLILGNLLYNVANLANPNGSGGLLALLNALGSGNLDSTAGSEGGSLTGITPATQQLLQIELDPLDINLLGLQITSDPIIVTIAAQGGDGKLLGNLLGAVSTLVNFPGVEAALNNALGTVVNLVNSVDLSLPPEVVGSGVFDTAAPSSTQLLDVFVAPVHLDVLGLLVTTSPIHLTITAHAGQGLVLGNVVSALAHLFDNPPPELTVDDLNIRLEQLLADLNAQIPGIPAAPTPPVTLEPGQFLELTVAPIDLNLLGLLLNTSPITVNAFAQTGDGNLLGNLLDSLLFTIDATPGNLTTLSENLNGLLAKVIGVLNASDLTLAQAAIDALPEVV
ncbi:MAG: hypothetical protein IAF94_13345, partial [Pirellulaceae bacterium]|nr:hypothetical protein [Pirellulaceae bacterium]